MLKKVAITGPESTGKSELAEGLAKHFKTDFVPEYSRDYLKEIGTNYTLDDVIHIAKGQLSSEEKHQNLANRFLFCDTDMLVIKIWCQEVFNKVPDWVEKSVIDNPYHMYLLCYPDIDWKPDHLRENPHNREYLFKLFVKELEYYRFNYRVVRGQGNERLKNAITFVNSLSSG
jgi:NadR type nicotinamide-nucleotide adenylyltransferase